MVPALSSVCFSPERRDRSCLEWPEGRLTFAAAEHRLRAMAAALCSRGVVQGDRLSAAGLRPEEEILLFWVCLLYGYVWVPLPGRDNAEERRRRLDQAGVDVLLSRTPAPEFGGRRVEADPVLAGGDGQPPDEAGRPLAPALILFTSGSSGKSRAVLHSRASLVASARSSNEFYQHGDGQVWLLCLPLHHTGGLMVSLRTLLAGGTTRLAADPGQPLASSPSPPAILSLVPTQLLRLLEDPRHRKTLQSSRAILLGGGPCPRELWEAARRAGLPLSLTWGSTESASQISATRPGEDALTPDGHLHQGRILPGREVTIRDGVAAFRGTACLLGYVEGRELIPATDAEGWFLTGDLAQWAPDGRIRILGRADDIFISGGENIPPARIEEEAGACPYAGELLVVPAPDDDKVLVPALVFYGPEVDHRPFAALLRQRLPGIMQPGRYFHRFPRPGQLKPGRAELREQVRRAVGADPLAGLHKVCSL